MNSTILISALLIVCQGITKKVDTYSGETHYQSPIGKQISIHKYVNEDTTYYLYLNTIGYSLSLNERGVKLKLDNDSILEWDGDISVDYLSGNYRYSAMVELDQEQLRMLSDNLIVSFMLYVYDGKVSKGFSRKINEYINCIQTL